jgi:hypothetical protein
MGSLIDTKVARDTLSHTVSLTVNVVSCRSQFWRDAHEFDSDARCSHDNRDHDDIR